MDKIIFLKDGKVRNVGTHSWLYEIDDEYRNMVELQRLDAAREEKDDE